jgi:cytochrome c-type biogenesis protein CcmH
MKKIVLLLMLFAHSALYAAPMDQFEFDTPEQEEIFHKLSQELRCLVCQNQAIAESDAGLAKDLRTEIHKMLKQGKTEKEITDFMVQRYGDFVLYDPPFKPSTWLLWFGPVIAFIFGMFYAVRFFRSQKTAEDAGELSSDEVERLRSLQSELDASGKGDSK